MPQKRTGLIVGALAAVAVLGVGAFVLLSKDDDDDDGELSTGAMQSVVQELVAQFELPPDESVGLDGCPAGELSAYITQAPPGVQAVAAATDEPSNYIYRADTTSSRPFVNCAFNDESFELSVGLLFGEVESDHRSALGDALPGFDFAFEAEVAHRGGKLLRYCAGPEDPDGAGAFCAADWFDDDVWVGVYITSQDATSDTAQEWLVEILPDVIAAVAGYSPDAQTANT